MKINVAQQLKGPVGSVRGYKIDDDIDLVGNRCRVQGEVNFTRTDKAILVEGTLATHVELTCSRCLVVYTQRLTFQVEEEFHPTIDINTGYALVLPDEPESFTIDARHMIDLTEPVRQNALTAMPMKPLCREDCAGLCPVCGANLNQGLCGCERQPADPRWADLLKLLKK